MDPFPIPEKKQRLPRWPFVLGAVLLLLGVGIGVALTRSVPYYAVAPGTVEDVTDFVSFGDETEVFDARGDFFFLTVFLNEVNVFEYLEALIDDSVDLRRRDVIRPEGVSPEELTRRNLDLMEESKQKAIFVALSELGYEATFGGDGALIVGVVPDTPADGVLLEQDVIVAVDGRTVEVATQAVSILSEYSPGRAVHLDVERIVGETADDIETIGFDLVLAPNPDDETRGFVGVFLDTLNLNIDFPVEVGIDSQNIGGPSAGLMYTLGIINELTEGDLTRGHLIAGTGTIDFDGSVGAIGGVKQKVVGARRAGAEYVLVPGGNFDDAVVAADGELEIVRVETLADALEFLDSLPPAGSFQAQGP
ncbi:MAG: PDZ domain-containing protein [Acidimicrobiia bacterium]